MLEINETYVNVTKGHQFGESGWYEPFTQDKGRLFRSCQQEFGRCVSSLGCDYPDRTEYPVGWVFQKKMEYEDWRPSWGNTHDRYYIREVWVMYKDFPDPDESPDED